MDINFDKATILKVGKLSNSDIIDRRASYFIISYYLTQILNLTTKSVFPVPERLYPRVSAIFGIILVVFFLMSIFKMLKRSLVTFILVEFLFIGLYLISYLMGNADTRHLLESAFWTIATCVPMGIYIYHIKNKEIFYKLFLKSSYVMTFMLFIMYFFPIKDSAYSMSFSSALRIPTILHINEWFNTKKKLLLVLFIAEIMGITLQGSRGALLSIGFFIIIKFILNETSTTKKITIMFASITSLTIIYLCFDKIGFFILNFLARKGYYSRTLNLLFSGRITYDSGRFNLFKHYFDLILQKPIIGWGVLGGWIKKGSGPHNMLIEYLLAFGVFIGGAVILLLILSQFRVFFIKDKRTRELIMIYMSLCFGLYFVSGGFLTSQNLFICIGMILFSFKKEPIKRLY